MHIQKLSAAICVAAIVGASSPKLFAADNAIDAKMREALRQEIDRQNSTNSSSPAPAPAAPAPAPTPAATPTPAAAPAPATAPELSPAPAPQPRTSMPPDQEQALRDALHKAMADLNAQQAGAQSAAQPVVQPVVQPPVAAPQPAAPVAAQPVQETPAASPAPAATPVVTETPGGLKPFNRLSPDEQQKLLDAERAEMARLNAADQAGKPKANVVPVVKEQNDKVAAMKAPEATPAAAMAPAPGSKEQRLYELLQLYKADKITPYEYHQERAKILAE